jgi:hypothetical protein
VIAASLADRFGHLAALPPRISMLSHLISRLGEHGLSGWTTRCQVVAIVRRFVMRRTVTALALAAGVSAIGLSAAPAMPIDRGVAGAVTKHEQARVVCNEYGPCWRTGLRYSERPATILQETRGCREFGQGRLD